LEGKNFMGWGGRGWVRAKRSAVKRWSALAGLGLGLVLLVGCREVRVTTLAAGTTTVLGANQITIVRDAVALGKLGIHAPVHYKSEFGVVLLMGPHDRTGYKQIVESIRANLARVRVVAFEQAPADGGEPSPQYRTYTLWIVESDIYQRGVRVEVVTPSNEPIASTYLP
jgi:multidrug efflux pump subunit AcrA (membrane-fusion protein)